MLITMNKKIAISLICLACLTLAAFLVYAYIYKGVGTIGAALPAAAPEVVSTGVSGAAAPPTRQAPAGQKEYRNERYHFSLFYPEKLAVKEYGGGGEPLTVVFESEDAGFQVFVVPYGRQDITPERLKMDIPSGVIKEPTDIVVAGVRGTMFWSENPVMGETREVWFINGGLLYEVTTYKALDAWLAGIMRTWRFLP